MMSLNITYIMNNSFEDSNTEEKIYIFKINNFTRIFMKLKKYIISNEKNKDLVNLKIGDVQ